MNHLMHHTFHWQDQAENHKLDICDYEKILPLFDGVDTVFHCAAEARIQPAIINPLLAVKQILMAHAQYYKQPEKWAFVELFTHQPLRLMVWKTSTKR